MAHQAHQIPWNVLASNFSWRLANPCSDNATDFHWRHKPTQGSELTHFVRAFARNVRKHADAERAKYPQTYEPPASDDQVVLGDDACRAIFASVRHWHADRCQSDRPEVRCDYYPNDRKPSNDIVICPHRDQDDCGCPLPWDERKMTAFLRPYAQNGCYRFWDENSHSFFSSEVTKMLLLHGEMDTLLRICSHPGNKLAAWWIACTCPCMSPDLGWDRMVDFALTAYILLNFVYCFPETWQHGEGGGGGPQDYRNTRTYQRMVRFVTKSRDVPLVATYPHRQFFGITDHQFNSNRFRQKDLDRNFGGTYPYGRMPYDAFLSFEREAGYVPLADDLSEIRRLLRAKGLPTELADDIIRRSQHPLPMTRRLPVAHDPFHPRNRDELARYLKYCWVILVRCEVATRAVGVAIKWEERVSEVLVDMFACVCSGGRNSTVWGRDWNSEENTVVFITPRQDHS